MTIKGSWSRVKDTDEYEKNHDRIFRAKKGKKDVRSKDESYRKKHGGKDRE